MHSTDVILKVYSASILGVYLTLEFTVRWIDIASVVLEGYPKGFEMEQLFSLPLVPRGWADRIITPTRFMCCKRPA